MFILSNTWNAVTKPGLAVTNEMGALRKCCGSQIVLPIQPLIKQTAIIEGRAVLLHLCLFNANVTFSCLYKKVKLIGFPAVHNWCIIGNMERDSWHITSELVCGFSLTDHFRLYTETESMPDPEAFLHPQHACIQPEASRKLYSGKQRHNRKEFRLYVSPSIIWKHSESTFHLLPQDVHLDSAA